VEEIRHCMSDNIDKTEMRFNGSDYVHQIDSPRLTEQHERIRALMSDQNWRTLKEIALRTGDPEPSVSAQLRHLRKKRFGCFVIEKRARGSRENGLFEYRLMPPGYTSEYVVVDRKNRYREALELLWKHKDFTEEMKTLVRGVFKD